MIPPDLIDDAVGDGLAWEMRLRALPARLGAYFVLGCALLSAEPYGEVIRQVTAGLGRALAAVGWQVPATTAPCSPCSATSGGSPRFSVSTPTSCSSR